MGLEGMGFVGVGLDFSEKWVSDSRKIFASRKGGFV